MRVFVHITQKAGLGNGISGHWLLAQSLNESLHCGILVAELELTSVDDLGTDTFGANLHVSILSIEEVVRRKVARVGDASGTVMVIIPPHLQEEFVEGASVLIEGVIAAKVQDRFAVILGPEGWVSVAEVEVTEVDQENDISVPDRGGRMGGTKFGGNKHSRMAMMGGRTRMARGGSVRGARAVRSGRGAGRS